MERMPDPFIAHQPAGRPRLRSGSYSLATTSPRVGGTPHSVPGPRVAPAGVSSGGRCPTAGREVAGAGHEGLAVGAEGQ